MTRTRIYLLAGTAILMWSTAGTAFKLALEGMGFIQLLFLSSTTAWLVLLIVILAKGKQSEIFTNPKRNIPRSALGGLMNPFLYYLVLLKAYTLLPAQIAQPLNYTWPVMLVLLSALLLKQRLRGFDLLAIGISFSGVVLISIQGHNPFTTPINQPIGILLAVGSSIIWAYFWIYNIKDNRSEIVKLTLNFFFGSLFSGILLLVIPGSWTPWSSHYFPALYVGITEMAIAFVCWLTALENSSHHARISNLVFVSPFLALFFIHLVLGEQIYWTTPFGLLFIVGGILLQQVLGTKDSHA